MSKLNGSANSRRDFLLAGISAGGVTLLRTQTLTAQPRPGAAAGSRQPPKPHGEKHEAQEQEEVGPGEDLMREHGVLKRILLIYEEQERRLLGAGPEPSPDAVHKSASLIRSFIEDYHEKLEEDYLFPRYRKANTLVDLVEVLATQHQAGRRLTDRMLKLATNRALKDQASRRELAATLRQFIRMYAPHEAREDTVLFPALRKIVTPNEYDALGEDFEEKEHQLLGEVGFEAIVDRVAAIEKAVGLYDLAQFTPRT